MVADGSSTCAKVESMECLLAGLWCDYIKIEVGVGGFLVDSVSQGAI
jgi:hypothetical protein